MVAIDVMKQQLKHPNMLTKAKLKDIAELSLSQVTEFIYL